MSAHLNLDQLAAAAAERMVKQVVMKHCGENNKKQVTAAQADNLFTKMLGVLQENGVYAGMLFLLSRAAPVPPRGRVTMPEDCDEENFAACHTAAELLRLLAHPGLAYVAAAFTDPRAQALVEALNGGKDAWNRISCSKMEILEHFSSPHGFCVDRSRLFLVKQLFEQTLTYARYAAKAQKAMEAKTASGSGT
jgi:hypothetical protein